MNSYICTWMNWLDPHMQSLAAGCGIPVIYQNYNSHSISHKAQALSSALTVLERYSLGPSGL